MSDKDVIEQHHDTNATGQAQEARNQENMSVAAYSAESGDTFQARSPVYRVSGLDQVSNLDYEHSVKYGFCSRRQSQNLDDIFENDLNFQADFNFPSFEPIFGKRESSGPLQDYAWTSGFSQLKQK